MLDQVGTQNQVRRRCTTKKETQTEREPRKRKHADRVPPRKPEEALDHPGLCHFKPNIQSKSFADIPVKCGRARDPEGKCNFATNCSADQKLVKTVLDIFLGIHCD